jgi:phage gp36-like protein
MTYATATDISREFRSVTFEADTDISDTDITSFLDEADAIINTCLNNKYITPITGTESVKVLKRIEIAIVAARIASILDLKQQQNQPSTIKQEFNKKDMEQWAFKYLKDLENEVKTLPDATLKSGNFGMKSNFLSLQDGAFFKKSVDQW